MHLRVLSSERCPALQHQKNGIWSVNVDGTLDDSRVLNIEKQRRGRSELLFHRFRRLGVTTEVEPFQSYIHKASSRSPDLRLALFAVFDVLVVGCERAPKLRIRLVQRRPS